MARPAHAQAPHLLDRYELGDCIGRGGMAEVFHARLRRLGGFERDVAIKILLPQYASEREFVTMLLDEARISGLLDHPNVVQTLDVGCEGDVFYIVMEYVHGADLRTLAKRCPGARLPLEMSLYVVAELLRALEAVHLASDERGRPLKIVHRDVSPTNVLLDERGYVKLADFGIVHAASRLTRTRLGAVKGKSRYMAPEQFRPGVVDARADLYSVGVTLFEALLGEAARQSSRTSPFGPVFTWPRSIPSELVPDDVVAILRRALAFDPADRYADARSFRRDVLAALRRRAPDYDADRLAADIRAIAKGRVPSSSPAPVLVLKSAAGERGGTERIEALQEHTRPTVQLGPSSVIVVDDARAFGEDATSAAHAEAPAATGRAPRFLPAQTIRDLNPPAGMMSDEAHELDKPAFVAKTPERRPAARTLPESANARGRARSAAAGAAAPSAGVLTRWMAWLRGSSAR